MIEATKRYADAKGYAKDRFEFQMLYGIRRDLQTALVSEGYRMRIYVPFGKQWFPYFMRRLGERPANVGVRAPGDVSARGRRACACWRAWACRSQPVPSRPPTIPGEMHQRVSASQHRLRIDPFLEPVQSGAGRAEEHRRNAGAAENRGIGPEAHADDRARVTAPLPACGHEQPRQLVRRRRIS